MAHFIVTCSDCGITIRQCRCPGPAKHQSYDVCDKCKAKRGDLR